MRRGGRERQACPDPDCRFVHWDNPVPVVAAIVEHRIVPAALLKPWSQGTGPALRDWLAQRGLNPPVVEFGEHI